MSTEILEQKYMSNGERWLSVEEISAHLGISKETVYRWLEKEKIPAHRVGKLWKFKISEVDKWVTQGGATEDDGSKAKAKRRNT
jgi:excisionase family DNA binding protein